MKRTWYYLVRAYVKMGLRFYFKTIIIKGATNIPRNEAVIFAANHQNAFLDAIVIACTNRSYAHFLVRADIFKKRWAIRLLGSLNMMPVYRIRDGWQSLGKNQQTFEHCEEILASRNSIVIFPEGNHGSQRRLRNLSKGFSRVAFESVWKNPDRKIYIVPVGLNYSDPQAFRSGVSIYYGEPIRANDFFTGDDPSGAVRLKDELAARMKKLITHVDDELHYASVIQTLDSTAPNYLDPVETNRRIELIERGKVVAAAPQQKIQTRNILFYPFRLVSDLVNFVPLTVWHRIRAKIKDPVFIGSMKFVVGIFIFPAYYVLITSIVYSLSGALSAGVVFLMMVVSMLIRRSINSVRD